MGLVVEGGYAYERGSGRGNAKVDGGEALSSIS